MSGRLTFVTLPVAELEAGVEFYHAVFGWRPSRRPPATVFFEVPGVTVALMAAADYSRFVGVDDAAPAGGLHSWNVASAAEVDALIERARQAGAVIRREPAQLDWGGWAGVIESPAGHLWEIVWNPRLEIPGD